VRKRTVTDAEKLTTAECRRGKAIFPSKRLPSAKPQDIRCGLGGEALVVEIA
jgi:hypothetical protein